ncbi:hypothetical protein K3495_g5910 [Podosphaera aphanis]|nr:hypothetical protein K3495_g5910 [Podosphaera aphanis]
MLANFTFKVVLLALCLALSESTVIRVPEDENIIKPALVRRAAPVLPTRTIIDSSGQQVAVNTTVNTQIINPTVDRLAISVSNVKSTILVLARNQASSYSAISGLNAYGIPHEVVIVPQAGITLPVLNSSATTGNYGAIFVLSDVSYDYGGTLGFRSALTPDQWTTLFNYQISFGVRLVRIDVFPTAEFGTSAPSGGCCDNGVEQLISISDSNLFPTAGLKIGSGLSTKGLWHYPAVINNTDIAYEFAQFAPIGSSSNKTTAGVINSYLGRQQMVWFIGFSTDWSATSNFLQHASIHWATRGLYLGYRRLNLNTQVDDMFLESDIYSPAGTTFQIKPSDLEQHVTWAKTVNNRLPLGSNWFMELGHNGNGNIETAANFSEICGIGPIEYPEQIDTPLEWGKPLGSGVNLWPSTPETYPYTTNCTNTDALKLWFSTADNLNAFAHVSHTFTHEDQNNATYFDVSREISWNKAWLDQVGISAASKYSDKGIIPPAITGLHNGDAIKAWLDNGIVNVVGDNTRPSLTNQANEMWPLVTTVAANGYAGVIIVPRWATNIYYNCNLPACTVSEWTDTTTATGDFDTLIATEKETNIRHLLGLHHDPFMFHQANLDYGNAERVTVNGVTQKLSLFQTWVETITQELNRLVTWPVISQKHDDIAAAFMDRMTRDACGQALSWNIDPEANTIIGITITTTDNRCAVAIPVTVPGNVTDLQGFRSEKIGFDPLTIWADPTGSPISFILSPPIPL